MRRVRLILLPGMCMANLSRKWNTIVSHYRIYRAGPIKSLPPDGPSDGYGCFFSSSPNRRIPSSVDMRGL